MRRICRLGTVALLSLSLAVTPVFGDEQDREVQPEDDTAITEQQVAEPEADSWRFEDGELSEDVMDENAQLGSTMIRATVQATNGNTKDKCWWDSPKDRTKGYLKGIDISKWQGDVNWDKLETAYEKGKIDFIILRCGYGPNAKAHDDTKWKRNADACEARGIPYGVYLYSYASSISQTKNEAAHTLRLLKGYHPDYPVYYDLEDATVARAGSKTIRKMALEYCKILTDNGFRAGVYANRSWWTGTLGVSDGKKYTYSKWYAQWNRKCSDSACDIWQCSSDGSISGISGRVDINLQMISRSTMDKFMEGAYEDVTAKVTDVDDYYRYTSAATWLKNGPGVGYYKKVKLPKRTKVKIDATANGYGRIISDDDTLNNLWIPLDGLKKAGSIYGWETVTVEVPADEPEQDIQEPQYVTKKVVTTYSGKIVTSKWVTLGGWKYYLDENGDYLRSGTAVIDKLKYKFTAAGKSVKYTAKIKQKTYWRTGPGKGYKKKGTLKKNTKVTVVRTSGKWSQSKNGYWFMTKYRKNVSEYPKKVK